MAEFTVTVSSHQDDRNFSASHGSKFACRLVRPLEFKKPHAVALQSIAYTSIQNPRLFFGDAESDFVRLDFGCSDIKKVTLTKYTDDPVKFVGYVNSVLKEEHHPVQFAMKFPAGGGVLIELENNLPCELILDSQVATFLGFDETKFRYGRHKATRLISKETFDKIPEKATAEISIVYPAEPVYLEVEEPTSYSWDSLINSINRQLRTHDIEVTTSAKMDLEFQSSKDVSISFGKILEEVLGIDHLRLKAGVKHTENPRVHLKHETRLMLVKSNLVKAYQHGSNMGRVLKMILPPKEEAQQLTNFHSLEYYEVGDTRFEEIVIEISDKDGNEIDFNGYPVTVGLRFKETQTF